MNILEIAEINHGKELAEKFRHSNPNRFAFPLENLSVRFEPPVTTNYIDTENVLHTPPEWNGLSRIPCFYIEYGLTQTVLPMFNNLDYLKHFIKAYVENKNVLNLATNVIQTFIPSSYAQIYTNENRDLDVLLFVSHFHPVESIRLASIEDYNRIKNQ